MECEVTWYAAPMGMYCEILCVYVVEKFILSSCEVLPLEQGILSFLAVNHTLTEFNEFPQNK